MTTNQQQAEWEEKITNQIILSIREQYPESVWPNVPALNRAVDAVAAQCLRDMAPGIAAIVMPVIQSACQQKLEEVVKMVEGMRKLCEFCKSTVDQSGRNYDGVWECENCEEGKYGSDKRWDDIGFNAALDDVISKLKSK